MEQNLIQVKFKLEFGDVVRAYKSAKPILESNNYSGIGIWLLRLSVLITSVFGIWGLISQDSTGFVIFLTILFTLIYMMFLNYILARQVLKKMWKENTVWRSEIYYEFAENGVESKSSVGNWHMDWISFNRILETNGSFILFHPNNTFQIICKKGFESDQAISGFKRLAKERVQGEASFLETEKPKAKRKLF